MGDIKVHVMSVCPMRDNDEIHQYLAKIWWFIAEATKVQNHLGQVRVDPQWSQMIPKWSQMTPQRSQLIPKWSQMIQKWSIMICKWSQVTPKWFQNPYINSANVRLFVCVFLIGSSQSLIPAKTIHPHPHPYTHPPTHPTPTRLLTFFRA